MPSKPRKSKAFNSTERQLDRAQRHSLRRLSPQQIVGDEDTVESIDRYVDSVQITESRNRRWAQSRRMGKPSKLPEE